MAEALLKGIQAAVRAQFSGVHWQRCWTHFMRAATAKVGHKHRITSKDAIEWFQKKFEGVVLDQKKVKVSSGYKAKKKRKKASEEEAPKVEAEAEAEAPAPADDVEAQPTDASMGGKQKDKKGKSPVPERFQRVKAEEVEFLDPRLVDYSHESKGDDDWGNKANQILSAVRGKDFRHEKTKKKRGTYKGGRITQQVNSIKFDD